MIESVALFLLLWGQQQYVDTKAQLVNQFLQKHGAVGVAVAVVDGSNAWHWEAGYANKSKKRKVEAYTRFRLGSVSKPVAATLVMSLVEQGKLDLDKGVATYVAGYPDQNGTITLRRILCHTSGIRHYSQDKNDVFYKPWTTAEALAVFKDDPLLFTPGEKYSYSTHAYTVAVAAIESASRVPYRDYLRNCISQKVALTLDCEVLKVSKPERSELYNSAGKVYKKRQDNSWKYGGGGLESTAVDLAWFGSFVARGGLLNTETVNTMWTKQKLNDGTPISYGLGWDLGKAGFARHSGGQQGCSAYLLVDRGTQVAVAVLCNTDSKPVQQLAEDLYVEHMRSR